MSEVFVCSGCGEYQGGERGEKLLGAIELCPFFRFSSYGRLLPSSISGDNVRAVASIVLHRIRN